MRRVGILSDTHGFLNPALFDFFKDCDELWHAGDWGDPQMAGKLSAFKPVKGVYGNIDGREIRSIYPEVLRFEVEGFKVCMLHIGGYPGRYSPVFSRILASDKPDIMVCGHSHILKVMRDRQNGIMHFNPGAAGVSGFHKVCTALRLNIHDRKMENLEVWEGQKTQF